MPRLIKIINPRTGQEENWPLERYRAYVKLYGTVERVPAKKKPKSKPKTD